MFCLQGDIVLNKVSFAYPGREDSDVLRGVDLTLARGQVTALVGSSGAGKSTVTQLLCRFYDPGSGSVTVSLFWLGHLKTQTAIRTVISQMAV